jgi:signal peptidase I
MRAMFSLIGCLALILIVFFLGSLILGSYTVASENMKPELRTGDTLLVNKLAYAFNDPARGDIIIYRNPSDDDYQMKRIVGLPGDIKEIKNKKIYINGIELQEPYAKQAQNVISEEFSVPAQSFFVLEDNRISISDFLIEKSVPREDIKGRAWILAWPLDRIGNIANNSPDIQVSSEVDYSVN